MAAKLLEIPPSVKGAVVECGCWLGGTTTNLSVICDARRPRPHRVRLVRGAPAPRRGRRHEPDGQGIVRGELTVVQDNVARVRRDRALPVPQRLVQRHVAAATGSHRPVFHRRRPEVEHARLHRQSLASSHRRGIRLLRRVRAPSQLRVVLLRAVLARLPRHARRPVSWAPARVSASASTSSDHGATRPRSSPARRARRTRARISPRGGITFRPTPKPSMVTDDLLLRTRHEDRRDDVRHATPEPVPGAALYPTRGV